jgi:hypothetical protein
LSGKGRIVTFVKKDYFAKRKNQLGEAEHIKTVTFVIAKRSLSIRIFKIQNYQFRCAGLRRADYFAKRNNPLLQSDMNPFVVPELIQHLVSYLPDKSLKCVSVINKQFRSECLREFDSRRPRVQLEARRMISKFVNKHVDKMEKWLWGPNGIYETFCIGEPDGKSDCDWCNLNMFLIYLKAWKKDPMLTQCES